MVREKIKLALVLFAGIGIGAGAIQIVHAQTGSRPAYVVAEVDVKDPAGYHAYGVKVPATLKPYGARVLARGKAEAMEGSSPRGDIVIVGFSSLADAERWYSTPPYKDLIPERQRAADTRLYVVEGLPQ